MNDIEKLAEKIITDKTIDIPSEIASLVGCSREEAKKLNVAIYLRMLQIQEE